MLFLLYGVIILLLYSRTSRILDFKLILDHKHTNQIQNHRTMKTQMTKTTLSHVPSSLFSLAEPPVLPLPPLPLFPVLPFLLSPFPFPLPMASFRSWHQSVTSSRYTQNTSDMYDTGPSKVFRYLARMRYAPGGNNCPWSGSV